MQKNQALTGLRGLAVLLVLTAHTPIRHIIGDFGQEAVYLFFFLSAYLLTLSLERQNITLYTIKRFNRIYPLYFFVVSAIGLLIGSSLTNIILNLLFLQQLSGTFILSVSWSLIVEIQLYFLLPVIIYFLRKYGLKALIVFIALGYVTRLILTPYYIQHVLNGSMKVVYGNILEFIDMFAIASYISINRNKIKNMKIPISSVVTIILFICVPKLIEMLGINRAISIIYLVIPLYTVLISLLFKYILDNKKILVRLLSNRLLIFYGTISYSVYLLHIPILKAVKMLDLQLILSGILSIILITLLSTVTYFLIEKNGEKLTSIIYRK